jgi:hypothetical protein
LFIFSHDTVTISMLVYVDDIVVAGSCPRTIDRLLQSLSQCFPVKDLGRLEYFLGIEAVYNSGASYSLSASMLSIYSIEHIWRIARQFQRLCR